MDSGFHFQSSSVKIVNIMEVDCGLSVESHDTRTLSGCNVWHKIFRHWIYKHLACSLNLCKNDNHKSCFLIGSNNSGICCGHLHRLKGISLKGACELTKVWVVPVVTGMGLSPHVIPIALAWMMSFLSCMLGGVFFLDGFLHQTAESLSSLASSS